MSYVCQANSLPRHKDIRVCRGKGSYVGLNATLEMLLTAQIRSIGNNSRLTATQMDSNNRTSKPNYFLFSQTRKQTKFILPITVSFHCECPLRLRCFLVDCFSISLSLYLSISGSRFSLNSNWMRSPHKHIGTNCNWTMSRMSATSLFPKLNALRVCEQCDFHSSFDW